MIHVARVDFGAIRQQELRNLHRGGEVQRRLPVSAARVDHARIGRHQLSQLRHHSQPRRRMRIQHRVPVRQKLHHARVTIVQHAESAGPPLGSPLDVRARAQQHVDGCPIAPLHRRE
jgi:hypothetical protein